MSRELMPGVDLRLLEERDAPELYALVAAERPRLARWMPWAPRQTEADTLDFIRATRRQIADNEGFATAIVVDGRIAGDIGLHHVDHLHGSAEIGYWIAAAHEGRGIVLAAVRAYCDYAFTTLGLHRLVISAAIDNARSRAVAERAGFVFEGVHREAERVGDRRHDLAVYSRLSTDP